MISESAVFQQILDSLIRADLSPGSVPHGMSLSFRGSLDPCIKLNSI